MNDRSRYFDNTFPEYNDETLLGPNKKLTGKITLDIEQFLTSGLQQLQEVFENAIERNEFDSSHGSSVYTGTSGIAVLAQKMQSSKWKDYLEFHDVLLTKATLSKKRITFLEGDPGPLVLKTLKCKNTNDEEGMTKYAQKLLKFSSWSSERDMCNEVLYGRAGYLYSLLRLKQIDGDLVPSGVIQQLVDDIINAGVKGKKSVPGSVLPLYYDWHEKEYLGAAHGYTGIFYMLLQAQFLCPGVLKPANEELIISCLDSLLKQRFPSGNLPSSIGNDNDKLTHWCHGAPGAIHLYALAYKLYKKPAYLSACRGFADAIWTRGLLKKGYGLCHGVAGNGYALLCMFQLTENFNICGNQLSLQNGVCRMGSMDVGHQIDRGLCLRGLLELCISCMIFCHHGMLCFLRFNL